MAKRERMKPVRYNAGNMKWYRSALMILVRAMNRDVKEKTLQLFAGRVPPVDVVRHTLGELSSIWLNRFASRSSLLSNEMTDKTIASADRGLQQAAEKAGFKIKMQWTDAMQQKKDAIIAENVSLIRSIPEKYFTEVEGMVYRSVAAGGDRKALSDEIMSNFSKREGITRRRAEFIAKDQIRKATSALSSARQQAAGITRGIWVHSAGQANPRHKHVKANGQEFDLSKGLPVGDKGQYVMPGYEPGCDCGWRPVPPWEIKK